MRETKRVPPPTPPTPERALDDISAHLGEVLRRADDLLAEWSRFGDAVRVQVDREAQSIATTVGDSIDHAVIRGVEKAVFDQIGNRVNAISAELGRIEARSRALARAASDDRSRQRLLLWGILAGIVGANVLLAVLLLRGDGGRGSAPAVQPATAPPTPAVIDAGAPAPPLPAPAATEGSGSAAGSGSGSSAAPVAPADPTKVKAAAAPAVGEPKPQKPAPAPAVAPKTHGAPGHR